MSVEDNITLDISFPSLLNSDNCPISDCGMAQLPHDKMIELEARSVREYLIFYGKAGPDIPKEG